MDLSIPLMILILLLCSPSFADNSHQPSLRSRPTLRPILASEALVIDHFIMVTVNEAPKGSDMTLRFKSAGLVRGNHKKTHIVPYEEIKDPRFNWAEDYEL